MARSNDGSTTYLNSTLAVPSLPFTFSCWFYTNSNVIAQSLITLGDTGASGPNCRLVYLGNVDNDPVRMNYSDGTTQNAADITGAVITGTWHHACGYVNSTTHCTVFVDGANKTTDSTNDNISTSFDNISVAALRRSTGPLQFIDGGIAFPAVWGVTLSDAEVASLAAGAHPLRVRPSDLLYYWPLDEGETDARDLISNNTLTEINNLADEDNPPIVYPSNDILAGAAPWGISNVNNGNTILQSGWTINGRDFGER